MTLEVTWKESSFTAKDFCDKLGIPEGHKFIAVWVSSDNQEVIVYSRPKEGE